MTQFISWVYLWLGTHGIGLMVLPLSLYFCGRTSSYWKVKWQDRFSGRISLWHLPQTVATFQPVVWKALDSSSIRDPGGQQSFSGLMLLLALVLHLLCMTAKWPHHKFMERPASPTTPPKSNCLSLNIFMFYYHKFNFTEKTISQTIIYRRVEWCSGMNLRASIWVLPLWWTC